MSGRIWAAAATAGACLSFGHALGCSPFGDYCDEQAECLDGNDADIVACKEELSGKAGYYLAYECEEKWETYFECLETKSDCTDTGTGDKVWSDCNAQGLECECAEKEAKLLKCVENSSGYFEYQEPATTSTTTST